MSHDNCPTCGVPLGSLRKHTHVRMCNACQRVNPRGFQYCGFCASPLEDTQMRAHIAKVAAPPGGWPSLARELVEVRFFLDRGEVGEAFEMVQLLRQRWPGHPALEEFHGLTPKTRPNRIATGVNEVVDAVLADSADWAARAPRRAAPRWKAPAASVGEAKTMAHTTVSDDTASAVADDDHDGVRDRVTRRGHAAVASMPVVPVINPAYRETGPQPPVAPAPRSPARIGPAPKIARSVRPTSGRTDEAPSASRIAREDDTGVFRHVQARATKPDRPRTEKQTAPPRPPQGLELPEPTDDDAAPQLVAASGSLTVTDDRAPEVTRESRTFAEPEPADRTVVGPAPTRDAGWVPPKGLTIAVDALQPARPFETDEDGDASKSRRGKVGKKKKERGPAADTTPDDEQKRAAKARRRAAKFGQNIVGG